MTCRLALCRVALVRRSEVDVGADVDGPGTWHAGCSRLDGYAQIDEPTLLSLHIGNLNPQFRKGPLRVRCGGELQQVSTEEVRDAKDLLAVATLVVDATGASVGSS